MQSKFCHISNGEVHYLEGGRGKTIVFVPGTAITSKSLEEIGDVLAEHFHVIIPDLFKGESKFNTQAKSLADYSDALHEFVTQLDLPQFSLIGWSIGGLLVSSYVQKYPQNLDKLVFISTSTMHMDFMERVDVVLKGYLTLGFNSLFSLLGIRVVWLWISDGFENFLRHPGQFVKEIQIGMYEDLKKSNAMPVASKLFIAENDEYVSAELLNEANQDIKNLDIEIVNGRHDWFYHDKKLFVGKITQFLG